MKTKKIRIRQGFTIVELVIVIGVIGVLSAVLIPTFINLNNKANEAADQSLITNLNTQLRIKEQSEGKNKNMTEALADALEAGYKVENLTPKSGKDIVWNQDTDEFSQREAVPTDGTAYKYWTIAKSNNDLTKGYSSYLYFDPAGPVTVDTGFDVGEYEDIDVTFTHLGSRRDVIIRTNGGALTVNAPSSTVMHYEKADSVFIESIWTSSFHEHGTTGVAKIQNGRLVIEKDATIDGIYLQDTDGVYNNIKIAVVGDAELPSIARSDVDLVAGVPQKVVEIQTVASSEAVDPNPEYVWVESDGTTTSSVVSSSPTSATAVVTEPSAAATAAQSEVEEAATPIDENSQVRINAVGYATLVDAINAVNSSDHGGTIVVLKDIDFSTETYSGYKWAGDLYNPLRILQDDVTLDLDGHQFTNMGNNALCAGYILSADGRISNFTIQNGSLKVGKTDGVNNSYAFDIAGVDGAKIKNLSVLGGINIYSQSKDVVIEDCTVQGTKYYTVCAQSGSHVTIKGESFGKNTDSSVANPSMFWVDKVGSDSDCITPQNPTGAYEASSITVLSGSYTVAVGGSFYLSSSGYLKPVVKGGLFNFDPTEFVAAGFGVINNDNGTWSVVPLN